MKGELHMKTLSVDFSVAKGQIKPMHAVNNGPVYKFAVDQRITNLDSYRDAGIPYARTHDAAFYSTYGGEHIVDIVNIFPNFDADPEDPASYDFQLTDEYLRVIELAGTKTFYRLGNKIEHWSKKYGTLPPKDFHKWAVICEHIIRHYTEGWADGFHMDIEYWEIWNEPDLDPDDSTHKRCWGGTKQQFFELYDIAAKHLKSCFPHLKIGGPALAYRTDWAEDFLAQLDAPLDFFSWHTYGNDPLAIGKKNLFFRQLLDKHGYTNTESILNEWNYVKGWDGDNWIQTLKDEKSLKGAAFIAATMCISQKTPLDMLMYYDARPCGMNGMFNTDLVCECLKGYYPFKAFNTLYKLGTEVQSVDADDCWICAAKKDGQAAVMLSHFTEDPNATQDYRLQLNQLTDGSPVKVSFYLLDETHDLELVREETYCGTDAAAVLTMTPNSVYLVTIEQS